MLGRQMLGYIPVNLANILVSFGTIVVLTRILTPEEFGNYGIAMVTLQFFHMFVFTWVEASMARFQARAEQDGQMKDHLRSLYVSGLCLALIALPLLLVVLWALPLSAAMTMLLGVALTTTCFQVILNLGFEAHKAEHRIGRFSAIYSTHALMSFSIGIALILLTPLREVGPFLGILIATMIALIIDLPFMLRRLKGGVVDKALTRSYFAYGMPICLSLLLGYTLSQGDLYLIGYFMGSESVGYYNAGYNLSNRTIEVLFIWIAMAVTPVAVTTLETQGLEKSRKVLSDYASILLLLVAPAATGIALVAQDAGFILGEDVRTEAVKIIPWIALSGLMNGCITYYIHRAYMLSKRTGMYAVAMIAPVILNIVLNLILIPKFGLTGAVIATVCAYALALVTTYILARKLYPLPAPVRSIAEIGLACAVMAAGVLSLPFDPETLGPVTLFIKAAVGMVIYAAVIITINAAGCRDFGRDMLQKLRDRNAQDVRP